MTDPFILVHQTIELLKPELISAGAHVITSALSTSVQTLWAWVKKTIDGAPDSASIAAIEESPTNEVAWLRLTTALANAVNANSTLVSELEEVLKQVAADVVKQTATIHGNRNQVLQNSGSGNDISIRNS